MRVVTPEMAVMMLLLVIDAASSEACDEVDESFTRKRKRRYGLVVNSKSFEALDCKLDTSRNL